MQGSFNLSMVYKDGNIELKTRFGRWGYIHPMIVLSGKTSLSFEPDGEGQFRTLRDKPVRVGLAWMVVGKLTVLSKVSV